MTTFRRVGVLNRADAAMRFLRAARDHRAETGLPLDAVAFVTTPDEGAALYRRGLRLSPGDGAAWLALADLLRYSDPAAAEEAYLQACRHGDPGANGCLRAGTLAEARGDTATAIEYYRLSNWEGAQEKAAALERLLPAP